MTPLRQFYWRPRSVWLRKKFFQVHLCAGIALAAYFSAMGVSGSILVFRHELQPVSEVVRGARRPAAGREAGLTVVLAKVREAYPGFHVISIVTPGEDSAVFVSVVQGVGRFSVASDGATGNVLGRMTQRRSWVDTVAAFHESLFAHRAGRLANGVGALLLLVMWTTGLVIWWPGKKFWKRGLQVDFRRRWKRINFDLHSAVAFWSSLLILAWGLTGVYFAWPEQVFRVVNRISVVRNAKPPAVVVDSYNGGRAPSLEALLGRSAVLDPGTGLGGVEFPFSRRAPLSIVRRRPGGTGREYEDVLYFNPLDGSYLGIWRYGVNRSLGDWLIWSQVPLHFGTSWGWAVKVVWCLGGLVLPLLAVTGMLMYWNRYLGKKRVTFRANG